MMFMMRSAPYVQIYEMKSEWCGTRPYGCQYNRIIPLQWTGCVGLTHPGRAATLSTTHRAAWTQNASRWVNKSRRHET